MEPKCAPTAQQSEIVNTSALIVDGLLRRSTERTSAGTYGGTGTEEVEELAAPMSAVQLVFASMGAPGNRYITTHKRRTERQT